MQKINFKNYPNTTTPVNADNLNLLQDNVEDALFSGDYDDLTNKPDIPEGIPVGTINIYAGSTAPTGYLICNGAAVSRTTYSNLFDVIGTTYGSGDGSTTFNVPNLKGKIPVGLDTNDTNFDTLGETGGEKVNSELHCGSTTWGLTNSLPGYMDRTIVRANSISHEHDEISAEISNLQPYIVLNYVIKY